MSLHLFGIRHHGSGCAKSLKTALNNLKPDLILIEAGIWGKTIEEACTNYSCNSGKSGPSFIITNSIAVPDRGKWGLE